MAKLEKQFWLSGSKEYLNFRKDTNGLPTKLNISSLRKILNSCLKNAQQYIYGADILLKNRLYSISALLSILGIEELGKRRIVSRYVWTEESEEARNRIWTSFYTHKEKIYWAFKPFILPNGNSETGTKGLSISLWSRRSEELESTAKIIDQIKMLSSYTNIIDGEIFNPKNFVTRENASSFLRIAREQLKYQNDVEVTDEIIKIYKEYRNDKNKGSLRDFIDI